MQFSPSAAEVWVKWLFLNESSLLCSVLLVLASEAGICPSTDSCGISSQMLHESNSYFEHRVPACSNDLSYQLGVRCLLGWGTLWIAWTLVGNANTNHSWMTNGSMRVKGTNFNVWIHYAGKLASRVLRNHRWGRLGLKWEYRVVCTSMTISFKPLVLCLSKDDMHENTQCTEMSKLWACPDSTRHLSGNSW